MERVQNLASRVVGRRENGLRQPADGNEREHVCRAPSVDEEAVNDVKLQHEAEKPVWSGLDNVVWVGQYVYVHKQLRQHAPCRIAVVTVRMQVADYGERHVAEEHKPQQLEVMIAHERHRTHPFWRALLVLADKAEAAYEQEHRHAVMPEERHNVYKQVMVGRHQPVPQHHRLRQSERIFVLLDGEAEEMAVVMKHYPEYGDAAECLRLGKGKNIVAHCLVFVRS